MPATPLDDEPLRQRLHDLVNTAVDLSCARVGPDREEIAKRYRVLEDPCYQLVAVLRDADLIDLLAEHAQLESVPSRGPFPYCVPPPKPMTGATKTWSPGAQQETDDATANARLLLWFAVAREPEAFGADVLFWQQLVHALPLYHPRPDGKVPSGSLENGTETHELVRPLGRIKDGVCAAVHALVHAAQDRLRATTTTKAGQAGAQTGDPIADLKRFSTLISIARDLRVSDSTLRRWRKRGILPVYKLNGAWVCSQSDLNRLRRPKRTAPGNAQSQ